LLVATVFTALAAILAILSIAALVAGGPSRARRWSATIVAASALFVTPLTGGEPLWLLAFTSLTAAWGAATVIDLARDPRGLSPFARVFQIFAMYDTRRARAIPPRFDLKSLLFGLLALATTPPLLIFSLSTPSLPLRWLAAAIFGYMAWESFSSLVRFGARATGREPPPLHDHPILSLSIGEFWNKRWNRVVGAWLERTFFKPLARRRKPRLGLAAAFFASALLHAYFVWVPKGAWWAAMIASFFVAQLLFILLEHALHIGRWPIPLRRTWTIGLLLLSSPLHMEPCLQLAMPQTTQNNASSISRSNIGVP
jgi:hypothetical protein